MINCYILSRTTFAVIEYFSSHDWAVDYDYVSASKSTFYTEKPIKPNVGDFIIAKQAVADPVLFKPLFFGVIESYTDKKIAALQLMDMLNFEITTTQIAGTDGMTHLYNLIMRYLYNDSTKIISNANLIMNKDSDMIAFSYQPNDPPSKALLNDYARNMFQKYGIIWEVEQVEYSGNNLKVYTRIKRPKWALVIKDNSNAFQDWKYLINPATYNGENKLVIIDKETTNMMNPTILATWYVYNDGTITTNQNGAEKPTREKVYFYDLEQEDPPTYESIARSELSASLYSHEIEFDLLPGNQLIGEDQIRIGTLVDVWHNDTVYKSIITGYSLSSKNDFISVKLGFIRSTLKAVLNNYESRTTL